MGVAVPASQRAIRDLPVTSTVKTLSEGLLYTTLPEVSFWKSAQGHCKSGFATHFFKGRRRKKAAAFLGEVGFTSCGTTRVHAGDRVYFMNVFSPNNNNLGVLVSCMCVLVDGLPDKCHPAAQWSLDVQSYALKTNESVQRQQSTKNVLWGHILPIRSSVGQDLEIKILSATDRYVIRFLLERPELDKQSTPWPENCIVTSMDGKIKAGLIIEGCPVSPVLDFRVHDSADANTLIISTIPFILESTTEKSPMVLRCNVVVVNVSSKHMMKRCYENIEVEKDYESQSRGLKRNVKEVSLLKEEEQEKQKLNRILSNNQVKLGNKEEENIKLLRVGHSYNFRDAFEVQKSAENEVLSFEKVKDKLTTSRRQLRLLSESANGPETIRKRFSVQTSSGLSGNPLNAPSFSKLGGVKERLDALNELATVETQSRLKALKSAIGEGVLDNTDKMISYIEISEASAAENRKLNSTTLDEYDKEFEQRENTYNAYLQRLTRIYPTVFNQYVVGPWMVDWGANTNDQAVEMEIAHPSAYGEASLSRLARTGSFNIGVRGNLLNVNADELGRQSSVGFAKKRYGINVDASQVERAAAMEVRARSTDIVTVADVLDRAFGQRVGVRNFGLNVRHDIDDFYQSIDTGWGTEVYFQYKTIAVAAASDILSTKYLVSVGMMGVNVAAVRDFNSYASTLQINWGRGWQIFLESNFPDDEDPSVEGAVGIGKPGRMYLNVGSGMGSSGIPVAAVWLHTPEAAIGIGALERAGQRVSQYSITAGRFTYLWESVVLPDNLELPLILYRNRLI